jgi:hypothetical protein
MALSTADLQAQLDTIIAALSTGESMIRTSEGRTVQYDLAALTRQRDWLQRQIANASRGPSVRLGRYNPDYDREARGG